jgi:DNA polymerase III delta subunit
MLYLLYGADTYRAKKNLREIVEKFLVSGSVNNLLRVTPENFSAAEFAEVARAASLLGGKYLYVGEGLIADPTARVAVLKELAAVKSSENVIVLWEEEIAEEILAALKTEANKVTEFAKLSGARLKNFVAEEAAARGVKISEAQLATIIAAHSDDFWGAVQDLEKLALGGQVAVAEHVPEEGESMFDLLDAFAVRDGRRAILLYEKYKSHGVPVEEIAWRLLWQVKTLSIIQALHGRSPAEIKKETGLHEFVIKKNSAAAAKWRVHEARENYLCLLGAMQSARLGETDLDYALTNLLLKF